MAISENEVLFQLLGTTYGGDGQETFNLPDLRGRLPLHQGTLQGNTFQIGQSGGRGGGDADDPADADPQPRGARRRGHRRPDQRAGQRCRPTR